MKTEIACSALVASLAFAISSAIAATAQSTTFTFQGVLQADGQPANGFYDMSFSLYDAPLGGSPIGVPIVVQQYPVATGLFTIDLDFPTAFYGQQRWLQVAIGSQVLYPRQAVNTVPVAQFALNGALGPIGPQGTAGATGVSGAQGATGPAGPAGPQGTAGATGAQGSSGAMGPTGPQGTAGAIGATGAQGVAGPTGPAGSQGTVGQAGATGTQGPTGPTGATGATGAAGVAYVKSLSQNVGVVSGAGGGAVWAWPAASAGNTIQIDVPLNSFMQVVLSGSAVLGTNMGSASGFNIGFCKGPVGGAPNSVFSSAKVTVTTTPLTYSIDGYGVLQSGSTLVGICFKNTTSTPIDNTDQFTEVATLIPIVP